MLLYKVMGRAVGLLALGKKRLKVSTFDSINDPFELLPYSLPNPAHRLAFEEIKRQEAKRLGILCFSEFLYNPVIWSHYAENHRGMALGFEIADGLYQKIDYIPAPLPYDPKAPAMEIVRVMMTTKFLHWQYECEYRVPTTLNNKEDHLYFENFTDNFKLVSVTLGAECSLTPADIRDVIGNYEHPVSIQKMRRSSTEFKMELENESHLKFDQLVWQTEPLRSLLGAATLVRPQVDRNALCTCGSGRKYKKCHGA